MKHITVYREEGVYAGWPANHGSWQWDDELLVGFIKGKYGKASMHNVVGPLKKVLARSKDGGCTWVEEDPGVDFEALWTIDQPALDPVNTIIRVCGNYDHGGDDCPDGGGFYASVDRGKTWGGAYAFSGLDENFSGGYLNTSRTCVIGSLVFLSSREERSWGTDKVLCCKWDGKTFQKISEIADERGRVVMPSVAKTDRLVLAARRRAGYRRDCWISAYTSDDGGITWSDEMKIAHTGAHNGNPPALIEANGLLVCTFANRDDRQMQYSVSNDGVQWSAPKLLRDGGESDIGYPRLFRRTDGQLVCVYYWADSENRQQHIAATIFHA